MAMNLADLTVTIHADGVEETTRGIRDVGGAIAAAQSEAAAMGAALAGMGAAVGVVAAIGAAFFKVGQAAVAAALPIDGYRRALAALTGDIASYENQMKRLTNIAKLPGLGLEEVFRGATQLQGSGITADTTAVMIKELGNAIALVGRGKGEFKMAVDQLAKMAGLGKVTAEDLGQIAAYAPTMRNAFQRALGTLDAEKIKKMGLSMEQIFKRVGRVMQDEARGAVSFQTAIDNLADSFQIAMEPLGTGLLTAFTRQTTYAQSFFDDLQKINEQLALMIMRTTALSSPMQAAFGSPALMMLDAFDNTIKDIIANMAQVGLNLEEFAYNAQLAFVRLLKAPLGLIDPNIAKGTDTGYKKYTTYDEARAFVGTYSNTMDAVARASVQVPKIGKVPQLPPTNKDDDTKESKNHLRRIEANTKKTADALSFARQVFGGRQLGQLGITAVEANQAKNQFRGTTVIPGSTMINRGLQQIINQTQRSYQSTPLARY
jgi:tape measure domain-containing protein